MSEKVNNFEIELKKEDNKEDDYEYDKIYFTKLLDLKKESLDNDEKESLEIINFMYDPNIIKNQYENYSKTHQIHISNKKELEKFQDELKKYSDIAKKEKTKICSSKQ